MKDNYMRLCVIVLFSMYSIYYKIDDFFLIFALWFLLDLLIRIQEEKSFAINLYLHKELVSTQGDLIEKQDHYCKSAKEIINMLFNQLKKDNSK